MTTAEVSPTQELPQPFPREDENQSPLGRKGLRSHLISSASMQAPVQATQQEAIPFYKLACLQVTYCLIKPLPEVLGCQDTVLVQFFIP